MPGTVCEDFLQLISLPIHFSFLQDAKHRIGAPQLRSSSLILLSAPTRAFVHNSKFYLVIVDTIGNDCVIGLAVVRYKFPFVIYNAVSELRQNHDDFGVSTESS